MCKFRKWLIKKLGGQVEYNCIDHYIKSYPAQCVTLKIEQKYSKKDIDKIDEKDQKEYINCAFAEKMAHSLIENNLLIISKQNEDFEYGFPVCHYAAKLVVVKDSDAPKGELND